jgi:hypothetical protein
MKLEVVVLPVSDVDRTCTTGDDPDEHVRSPQEIRRRRPAR